MLMPSTATLDRAAKVRARADRVAKIRELAEAGNNDIQIADKIGVCAGTVRRDRNANDIPPGHDPAKTRTTQHGTSGMWRRCACDICRDARNAAHATYIQRTSASVAATASNRTAPWTPEDDAVVLDTSITVAQAARQLGRTWSAVTGRRQKLRDRARAKPVQVTFLHHVTGEPTVIDLPVCPTCGQAVMRCARTSTMHRARRALIAPLLGATVRDVLALQPTITDEL